MAIVAGMATQPIREKTAKKVVRKLVPQIDLLVVHMDGFQSVPKWLNHPKIVSNLHPEGSEGGAAGKLDCLEYCKSGDTVILIDDDVKIKDKSLALLIDGLERQKEKSIVGFHGSVLEARVSSYLQDRKTTHISARVLDDFPVDVLATCLVAWKFDEFLPKPSSWVFYNMVDLQFALESKRHGMKLVLISRPKKSVTFYAEKQVGSIYSELLRDDSIQTGMAQELMSLS